MGAGTKGKSYTVEHRSLSNLGLNVNQAPLYALTSERWIQFKFNQQVKKNPTVLRMTKTVADDLHYVAE